ncbi:Sarcoma antigen 1 [Plecturocebus cupreus]
MFEEQQRGRSGFSTGMDGTGTDASVIHNVREEKMENGQPQPDNILSTVPLGLINRAEAAQPLPLNREWKPANSKMITSYQLVYHGLVIWQQLEFHPRVPGISIILPKLSIRGICLWGWHNALTSQLNLFIWFPDPTTNHNVCEERMKNGQTQMDNVLSNVLSGLINMAGAGIPAMTTRHLCMFVYQLHEERMENSQSKTDNVLSTIPPRLGHVAAAGIPSMSTKLKLFIQFPDANVSHNICIERMQNGQLQPDHVLLTGPTALIYMAAAGILAMSTRDLCVFAYKLYCLTWFSYACILNLFLWFPDATIIHSVREQKIENDQPAPDKVLLTLQPGLIHMAATGISSMST